MKINVMGGDISRLEDSRLLSVVVPAYNMEAYISKNLDSIVGARNIHAIEVIIINDGSTDNTLAVCRQYAGRYPEVVRVIDKANGHYGSCINAALKVAVGKYFRILDADDWFDTEALDVFVEKLDSCDSELVVTQRCEVWTDAEGNVSARYFPVHDVHYDRIYDAGQFLMSDHAHGVEFNMHSMTYRTDVLRAAGLHLPEGVCYTDMIYCLMPLAGIRSLIVYDIYLYHYWVGRDGSSTTNDSIRRNFGHITKVLSVMLDYLYSHMSDNAIVRANQFRFVDEASAIFLKSLRVQGPFRSCRYRDIKAIVDGWKQIGFSRKEFGKYYFAYWIRRNTCASLNFSLFLYRLSHPFK